MEERVIPVVCPLVCSCRTTSRKGQRKEAGSGEWRGRGRKERVEEKGSDLSVQTTPHAPVNQVTQ